MKKIGSYINGNFKTVIFSDGTKIRFSKDDNFIPAFSENCDIKITNFCDMNCSFCHEASTTKGKHGNILNQPFLDTLHPFTEMAIGGGNALSHPDLIPFLKKLRDKDVIPNITVHQKHFLENQELIDYLINEKLIFGLGVSYYKKDETFLKEIKKYPSAVIHTINGLLTEDDINFLADNDLKMLILGYKDLRRGHDYLENKNSFIKNNQEFVFDNLEKIIKRFKLVSFDNLSISQLQVKRLMTDEEWEEFYMGDDGSMTFYIDLVEEKFASSSTSLKRFSILDNIDDMFTRIKDER